MTTRRPTDPAALAAHLGAATFGGARWWTLRQVAAHHGYARSMVRRWMTRYGYAADLPQRVTARHRIEIWCVSPPPPPADDRPRANLDRHAAYRAAVVAAVVAAGGPTRGPTPFWPRIAAAVGRTPRAAQKAWWAAIAYGETL